MSKVFVVMLHMFEDSDAEWVESGYNDSEVYAICHDKNMAEKLITEFDPLQISPRIKMNEIESLKRFDWFDGRLEEQTSILICEDSKTDTALRHITARVQYETYNITCLYEFYILVKDIL